MSAGPTGLRPSASYPSAMNASIGFDDAVRPCGDLRADDRLQDPEFFRFVVRRPGEGRQEGDEAGHPSEGRSHARQLPGFGRRTIPARHDNRPRGHVIAGRRDGRDKACQGDRAAICAPGSD